MPRGPRTGHAWRKARETIRARRGPCCICGQPIDYALQWPNPKSFSVEHLDPVSLGGHVTNTSRLAASHLSCNASRGNGTRGQLNTSEAW